MQLYHAAASPFVRKVMVVLHRAGATGDVTLIPASGNPVDPGSLPVDQNPLGKIPALMLDDGAVLYDSRVVCRYLDARYSAGLLPDAPRLWQTLTLEAAGDGIMDAAVLMRYEVAVRATGMQDPAWLNGQWAKIARTLDRLEQASMDHLNGPIDMGVISVACALGYLDFRLADRDWRAGRARLAAFAARMSGNESMIATQPPV